MTTNAAGASPVECRVRPLVERLRLHADNKTKQAMQYDGGRAADELERLLAVLERIGAMDPATDSIEGYNEWGEADCFRQAQSAALMALGPNVMWTSCFRLLRLVHIGTVCSAERHKIIEIRDLRLNLDVCDWQYRV